MAVQIAHLLETYGADCEQQYYRNEQADHRDDQQHPDWLTNLPELPSFPSDPDGWRSLNTNLADEVLGLSSFKREQQMKIDAVAEYSTDDLGDEASLQILNLALSAICIARDLRSKYVLRPVNSLSELYLRVSDAKMKLDAKLSKKERAREEFWAELRPSAV